MADLQTDLPDPPITPSAQAAADWLSRSGAEKRGAVFTRREVVEFILDLVGYTPDKELFKFRLLEPSFGDGDFLLPAVERLLTSYRKRGARGRGAAGDLRDAIRAVELHKATFAATRARLVSLLGGKNINAPEEIADAWLTQGDFLLEPIAENFSHIVGNPPYVRQELIPDALMAEYRRRFQTIYDRADIYIPFIEKSLSLLEQGGTLGFICSDRWMKNRYGGPLRRMIAERFHLKFYVDMVDTPAFHSEVIAYPAITVIKREGPGVTRLAHQPKIDRKTLSKLARDLIGPAPTSDRIKELQGVTRGGEPWILESWDQLAVVRRLEGQFPTLKEANCKVGIGVATGADKIFIAPYESLDVEPSRKLPLVMTRDIISGKVEWRGYGVVNPFSEDGGLVSLTQYPKLAAYLNSHKAAIQKRHVSQKNPESWYRTIDRIHPALAKKPKLLIPDIKGEASVVYEEGRLYPHHNLYFITSDEWNLKALQAVLRSGIARLFVSTYSTKMRGGYLRFQAQYLRRIRVPRWQDVRPGIKEALIEAAEKGDVTACNAAVAEMYALTKAERAAIGANGR